MADLVSASRLTGRPMLFVDAVEDAVDEAADSCVLNFLATSIASLMTTFAGLRPSRGARRCPGGGRSGRRPPSGRAPVLGVLRDELVDLRLVQLGAAPALGNARVGSTGCRDQNSPRGLRIALALRRADTGASATSRAFRRRPTAATLSGTRTAAGRACGWRARIRPSRWTPARLLRRDCRRSPLLAPRPALP